LCWPAGLLGIHWKFIVKCFFLLIDLISIIGITAADTPKIFSVNLFSCDCSRWHYSDSVTENYKGCKMSPFYEKSTVQFYVRHKARLNVYSLVCSNSSQPISTRRKHYFKYVRALTKKKNGAQNACLFLNNRFVHFACEIDTNFNYISWY
jgi:hypothetical protein